jgi:hypothetical protein
VPEPRPVEHRVAEVVPTAVVAPVVPAQRPFSVTPGRPLLSEPGPVTVKLNGSELPLAKIVDGMPTTDNTPPTQLYVAPAPNSAGAALPLAGSVLFPHTTLGLMIVVPVATAVSVHAGPKKDLRPSENVTWPPQGPPVNVTLVISTYFFCTETEN